MFKHKKNNIQTYLSFLLAFLILFAYVLLFINYRNTREELAKSYINQLKTQYKVVINTYAKLADYIYHSQINKPEVKKLFAKGVYSKNPNEKDYYRKLLYKKLIETYNYMKKYNVIQLQFHEYNNRSYLRFNRTELFGDDLTAVRYSVAYVNKEKKYISGFEEGRMFNGYRFVYPLFIDNKHVGSVGISVSIKAIVEELSKEFNQKSQFIILKSQVLTKVFKDELSKNYSKWFIDDDYLLDKNVSSEEILLNKITEKDILKIKNALAKYKESGKPFYVEINFNSKPVVITFISINNFEGENIAYLFSLFDGEHLIEHDKSFYYLSVLMLLLFVLLILFTLYYKFSQEKIEKLATFDALSKVYVRRVIMNIIGHEYGKYKRYQTPFSVIMIDIDHFKKVNDTYGHQIGDLVLVGITEIIKTNIRKSDSVGRYGGEEFIVLLPETNLNDAAIVAEKLRHKVSEFDFHKVGKVTISLGVAEVSQDMHSIDDLIKEADKKLYIAKNEGRNKVVY